MQQFLKHLSGLSETCPQKLFFLIRVMQLQLWLCSVTDTEADWTTAGISAEWGVSNTALNVPSVMHGSTVVCLSSFNIIHPNKLCHVVPCFIRHSGNETFWNSTLANEAIKTHREGDWQESWGWGLRQCTDASGCFHIVMKHGWNVEDVQARCVCTERLTASQWCL